MSDWRPIETAPADQLVLVFVPSPYDDERIFIARRDFGNWRIHIDEQTVSPTHWMPLPSPPATA